MIKQKQNKTTKQKVWLESRKYDEDTHGGVLEPGEVFIKDVKPGRYVRLGSDRVAKVQYHSAGSTAIELAKTRTIKTRQGEEADITGNTTQRVARTAVVIPMTDKEVEDYLANRKKSKAEKLEPVVTKQGPGVKSQRDLDLDAKKLAEALLLENQLTYKQIHSRILVEVKGWNRSVSWVSNVAYYMRKEGRL